MIDNHQCESDFAHLNALLDNLSQLLDDEYNALKHGDIDGIELLLETKTELLRNIEGISKRIEPVLTAATGKKAEQSQQDLPSYMQDTLQRLENCQEQNNINGGSIEANRNFSHSLLNLLTGSEPKSNVYDASGQFNQNRSGALSTEA